MDQLEARLECLRIAEKKFQGPGGVVHPNTEPSKIVSDAKVYAEFVLGDHVESKTGSDRARKGADEK